MAFFWPGPPGAQGVGDLPVAKTALFVAVNGFISSSHLRHCPCSNDDGWCFGDGVEVEQQMCFYLANFVPAMLGLVLVLGKMAFPAAPTSGRRRTFVAVARWLVSLAKVSTVATVQLWVCLLYFCLRMVYITRSS
uniref:Uncharacterized protein n=1 Tax=Oryza punctata TaxID=4537 RepID=A0A0E0LVK5_ORYPU